MIIFELVQGKVEIEDRNNKTVRVVTNKMKVETPPKYHFLIRTIGESWAIINMNKSDFVLRPGSQLRLADDKTIGEINRNSKSEVKLFFGKKWASIMSMLGNEEQNENEGGNAVAGVRG